MITCAHPFTHDETANGMIRSDDRDSLLLKAMIRLPVRGMEMEARVRNLSAGGVMAEAPLQVANGDIIEIELRNLGWISGKVAWRAEGRFGIAFAQPIDPRIARKPSGQGKAELPGYLERLNRAGASGPLRSV